MNDPGINFPAFFFHEHRLTADKNISNNNNNNNYSNDNYNDLINFESKLKQISNIEKIIKITKIQLKNDEYFKDKSEYISIIENNQFDHIYIKNLIHQSLFDKKHIQKIDDFNQEIINILFKNMKNNLIFKFDYNKKYNHYYNLDYRDFLLSSSEDFKKKTNYDRNLIDRPKMTKISKILPRHKFF